VCVCVSVCRCMEMSKSWLVDVWVIRSVVLWVWGGLNVCVCVCAIQMDGKRRGGEGLQIQEKTYIDGLPENRREALGRRPRSTVWLQ